MLISALEMTLNINNKNATMTIPIYFLYRQVDTMKFKQIQIQTKQDSTFHYRVHDQRMIIDCETPNSKMQLPCDISCH